MSFSFKLAIFSNVLKERTMGKTQFHELFFFCDVRGRREMSSGEAVKHLLMSRVAVVLGGGFAEGGTHDRGG